MIESRHLLPHPNVTFSTLLVGACSIALAFLVASPCGCSSKLAEAKRNAETKQMVAALASEIEGLRKKNGRLPKDEAELVTWLGKPMPMSAWKRPLEYKRVSENPEHFRITTVSEYPYWLVFQYNSAKAEEGVTTSTF